MSQDYYQFHVGNFKCTAVNDCKDLMMTLSPRFGLSNASEEELFQVAQEHGFEPDEWEREAFINCLLVDTGSRRILFDVGMGTPNVLPSTGNLRPALQSAGIAAEDVDTVILTHGHWDHVAGLVDDEGRLFFPNADYMMQRDEWDFWIDRDNKHLMPNFLENDLISFDKIPLISERVRLFDPEGEILPGVHAIAAPGHTPGHTAFSIISGGQSYYTSPTWHITICTSSIQSGITRSIFYRN